MIKTYKFAITGADSTDVVHFLGFADSPGEAHGSPKARQTDGCSVAISELQTELDYLRQAPVPWPDKSGERASSRGESFDANLGFRAILTKTPCNISHTRSLTAQPGFGWALFLSSIGCPF
jgi:hypothetical protein